MKCTSCNERLGNTRCEGCNTLFCLPCMIKHHDGLTQQFQSLTNIRNEVKESLDISQSTLIEQQQLQCFLEINLWESQMTLTIRMIAANARKEVTDIVTKYMKNINQNLEQISTLMQQREKEQNYLENDIETMKNQLNELKDEINNINRKVEVDFSRSTNINWNTLIHVIETNSVNQAASSQEIAEKKSQKDKIESSSNFKESQNPSTQNCYITFVVYLF